VIVDRAVTQLRETHPDLRARVAVNGAGQPKLVAGDVNTLTRLQSIEKGRVRVTFDTQNTLGAGRSLSQCAFTATPEAAFESGAGALKKLRLYAMPPSRPARPLTCSCGRSVTGSSRSR
jgi:hypothetical protein